MTTSGSIVFRADDGSEFEMPVNQDGTCGPLPVPAVIVRYVPPPVVSELLASINAGIITREEAMGRLS